MKKSLFEKAATILLVLVMLLSLAACGSNNKKIKEMLIDGGMWIRDWSSRGEDYISLNRTIYEFQKDNTYTEYSLYTMNLSYTTFKGETKVDISSGCLVYTGKYSLNDDFIVLKQEKKQSVDDKDYTTVKSEEDQKKEIKIPYAINEYTKELLFDVDRNGKSDYYTRADKETYINNFPKYFRG